MAATQNSTEKSTAKQDSTVTHIDDSQESSMLSITKDDHEHFIWWKGCETALHMVISRNGDMEWDEFWMNKVPDQVKPEVVCALVAMARDFLDLYIEHSDAEYIDFIRGYMEYMMSTSVMNPPGLKEGSLA